MRPSTSDLIRAGMCERTFGIPLNQPRGDAADIPQSRPMSSAEPSAEPGSTLDRGENVPDLTARSSAYPLSHCTRKPYSNLRRDFFYAPNSVLVMADARSDPNTDCTSSCFSFVHCSLHHWVLGKKTTHSLYIVWASSLILELLVYVPSYIASNLCLVTSFKKQDPKVKSFFTTPATSCLYSKLRSISSQYGP